MMVEIHGLTRNIVDGLMGSSLIAHHLTAINNAKPNAAPEENAVFFGTGVVAGKVLTQGLPLDFIGYLLSAERARRAFGYGRIVHLIADNHAKHELPERAREIGALYTK